MAICKPKILFLYSKEADCLFFNKYEVFYDVIKTTDSVEAVKLALENYNVLAAILIDDSPAQDIIPTLSKFNNMDLFRKIPAILITANQNTDFIKKVFDLGVFDVFFKPTDFDFAKQKLSKIIDLFNNRNQLERIFNQQMTTISVQETELKENQWHIIETLGQALESRDVESGNHCDRMKVVTETFLNHLAVKHPEYMLTDLSIRQIAKVTPLHDIGKIAIPDRILLKPESAGRFTEEEFAIMKTHTLAGCQLIDSIPNFKESSLYKFSYNICRYHHERWDGRGYPDRLKGMQIPIEAQVVALADVFDALISKRVYKPSFTLEKTKEMINNGECGVFNPDIINCFNICADDIYDRIYHDEHIL